MPGLLRPAGFDRLVRYFQTQLDFRSSAPVKTNFSSASPVFCKYRNTMLFESGIYLVACPDFRVVLVPSSSCSGISRPNPLLFIMRALFSVIPRDVYHHFFYTKLSCCTVAASFCWFCGQRRGDDLILVSLFLPIHRHEPVVGRQSELLTLKRKNMFYVKQSDSLLAVLILIDYIYVVGADIY